MRRLLPVVAAVAALLGAAPARAERRYILVPGTPGMPGPPDVPSRLVLDAGLGVTYVRAGARMNGIA